MSTSFIAIAGVAAAEAAPRLRAAMAWAPHAGERQLAFSAPCGGVHVAAHATMSELLRGEPWALAPGRATVADGWAVLPAGDSARLADAADLAATLDPARAESALDRVDGQVALVDLHADALVAANGFLGVPQLYWASWSLPGGRSVLVVGNRPWMVAAALHGATDGSMPTLDPMMLGWLLSKSRVPLATRRSCRACRFSASTRCCAGAVARSRRYGDRPRSRRVNDSTVRARPQPLSVGCGRWRRRARAFGSR